MIQKRSIFVLLACATAVITASGAARVSVGPESGAPPRPDLSGQWQVNRELSENAQEKLRNVGGGGEHHAGGGAQGSSHGSGGHGSGSARPEEKHSDEGRDLIMNAPARFVLTQNDQKVVITEPDGRVRTLLTNNRKVKVDGRDVQTRWENNRLVSETTVGNVKITETYERSPSARQLIVTARINMQGQQVSVRRVYDTVNSAR